METIQSKGSKPIFHKVHHVVEAGDTLIGLALRYGVTVAEIRSVNKIPSGSSLHIGQTIGILTTTDIAVGQAQPAEAAGVAAAFAADGDDDEDDGYAAAAADLRIRFFLKVKAGPLLRYFNKGYEMRWIYLVDQHILDFDSAEASTPSRVYELKYPQAVAVRMGVDIQITFTKSKRNHRTVRLFLRAASEEEAADWHAVMDTVSRKRIGTSRQDDRHITFQDYFANITLLGHPAEADLLEATAPEDSRQYPLHNFSFAGWLRGAQYGPPASSLAPPGEAALRSSLTRGDPLMDDALDAIGDICVVDPYSLDVVDVLLNSYKSANSTDSRMQDIRLQALKALWTNLPHWFDAGLCERGRAVLCARAAGGLLQSACSALAVVLASPQTALLLRLGSREAATLSAHFTHLMSAPYGARDKALIRQDMLPLVDALFAMVMDVLLHMCSSGDDAGQREYSFNDGFLSYGGHLCRGAAPWERLVRVRAYFSIIRRRAMCLFGKSDHWPFEIFGLPLNQAYCTFIMSVFSSAVMDSVRECPAEDKIAVLMECRYISHLLGFDMSKHGYIWESEASLKRVAASACTLFTADTGETAAAIACLRKVQTLRTKFFQGKSGGYQFEYLITQACGIDFAKTHVCKNYTLGRLGVYLWMLFCHLIFSMFRVQPPAPPSAGSSMGDNYYLEESVNAILPEFCEYDKDFSPSVCMKMEYVMERKKYNTLDFNE